MYKSFLKSDVFRMISALAAVGVISALVLVFVYDYARPKIAENIREATYAGIRNIFPEADNVEESSLSGIYLVLDKQVNLLGYAFIAEASGYQGPIKVIAGVDTSVSEMKGLEILESQETPGLGAEIAGDFREQFAGLNVSEDIAYVKNKPPEGPGEVEAITGATISSKAVVNMLNNRLEEIRGKLGDIV